MYVMEYGASVRLSVLLYCEEEKVGMVVLGLADRGRV